MKRRAPANWPTAQVAGRAGQSDCEPQAQMKGPWPDGWGVRVRLVTGWELPPTFPGLRSATTWARWARRPARFVRDRSRCADEQVSQRPRLHGDFGKERLTGSRRCPASMGFPVGPGYRFELSGSAEASAHAGRWPWLGPPGCAPRAGPGSWAAVWARSAARRPARYRAVRAVPGGSGARSRTRCRAPWPWGCHRDGPWRRDPGQCRC